MGKVAAILLKFLHPSLEFSLQDSFMRVPRDVSEAREE